MFENVIAHWETIVFTLIAFGCIELLRRLENYWSNRRRLSDEEFLAHLARTQNTSEYEIFRLAAKQWTAPGGRVDEQFKNYLKTGQLPHYVRDYIRKARKANGSI